VQIDLETGGRIDSNLQNYMCTGAPKQRIYEVVDDSDYLWLVAYALLNGRWIFIAA
jgi:hypothetical protein